MTIVFVCREKDRSKLVIIHARMKFHVCCIIANSDPDQQSRGLQTTVMEQPRLPHPCQLLTPSLECFLKSFMVLFAVLEQRKRACRQPWRRRRPRFSRNVGRRSTSVKFSVNMKWFFIVLAALSTASSSVRCLRDRIYKDIDSGRFCFGQTNDTN